MTLESVRSLVAAMENEAASFDAYVEGQRVFAEALSAREWPALHRATHLVEGLIAGITAAEEERARTETFLRLEMGVLDEGVHRLAFRIPEPERSELLDVQRRLKISAMRARLETNAVGEYAATNRDLLASVLEELFPEKKNRIYGRSGKAVQPGADAFLLDAAL